MNIYQYILDKVIAGIYDQSGPAYDHENQCCYYRIGDCKCAAGHLIKDNHYSNKLEHKSASSIYVKEAIVSSLAEELNMDKASFLQDYALFSFIRYLQNAHDSAAALNVMYNLNDGIEIEKVPEEKEFFPIFEYNLRMIVDYYNKKGIGLALKIPGKTY